MSSMTEAQKGREQAQAMADMATRDSRGTSLSYPSGPLALQGSFIPAAGQGLGPSALLPHHSPESREAGPKAQTLQWEAWIQGPWLPPTM